ncbi:MAG: type II toxin-antitoxin system prevent-host-death family antitoxin [Rhodospirillaceae bacterium]|nr:type II toxin-antitoxin system prevent-host-death family antitoxin [Rhodospirillaceae bacterium]
MAITRKVGMFEAKTHFSALVEEVRNGAEIEITKRGETVARMIPSASRDPVKIRQAIEGLQRLSQTQTLNGLKIKDLINEGRKY